MPDRLPRREGFLYLTTTGRASGAPREIEIWFAELRGRYYVISERREEAHWVRNLRREPRVEVEVGARRGPAQARALEEAADAALLAEVRAAFDRLYEWSDGLVVELAPETR
jgi:deazaflavin-dependent oxidoreductase (nitroreductase family)